MPAWLVVGNLSLLQELDQCRTADAEKIRGLLSCEPLRAGHHGNDLAFTQTLDNLDQDPVYLLGQRHLLAVRPEQKRRVGMQFQETAQVEQRTQVLGREDNAGPSRRWCGVLHDISIAQFERIETRCRAGCMPVNQPV
jgi:hypothetical protein